MKIRVIYRLAEELGASVINSDDELTFRIDTGDQTSKDNYDDLLDMSDMFKTIYGYQLKEWWVDHDTQEITFEKSDWFEKEIKDSMERIIESNLLRTEIHDFFNKSVKNQMSVISSFHNMWKRKWEKHELLMKVGYWKTVKKYNTYFYTVGKEEYSFDLAYELETSNETFFKNLRKYRNR